MSLAATAASIANSQGSPYNGLLVHHPCPPSLLPTCYLRPTWPDVSAALTANPPADATEHAQLRALVDRQLAREGGVL